VSVDSTYLSYTSGTNVELNIDTVVSIFQPSDNVELSGAGNGTNSYVSTQTPSTSF